MTSTAEQVSCAEPVSAHPEKLRDQIADNHAILEDTEKKLASLRAIQEAAQELLAGGSDETSKGE